MACYVALRAAFVACRVEFRAPFANCRRVDFTLAARACCVLDCYPSVFLPLFFPLADFPRVWVRVLTGVYWRWL